MWDDLWRLIKDPWAALAGSVLMLSGVVWRLVSRSPPSVEYDGPERRKSMRSAAAELAEVRATVERNVSEIAHIKVDLERRFELIREDQAARFASVHARFDRQEEFQRRGDTQTARELGQLTSGIANLEANLSRLIAGVGRFRNGATPSSGNQSQEE